jgi:hypothetical protein
MVDFAGQRRRHGLWNLFDGHAHRCQTMGAHANLAVCTCSEIRGGRMLGKNTYLRR